MCVYFRPSHHHEVAARESAPSNGYLRVAVFFAQRLFSILLFEVFV